MSNTKLNLPAIRLVVLAALAGVVAGIIAVYVMGEANGNQSAANGTGPVCAAKAPRAAGLKEYAVGDVAAMLPSDTPQSVRDLTFEGPAGKQTSIADMSGKVLLVNLWATWCAPCREEMPALDVLQKDMGSDQFEVVAISVDRGDIDKPKNFLDEIGIEALNFYRDNSMGVFNDLKRKGIGLGLPVTVLVDEDGCAIAQMNGPAEWASEDAKALIRHALQPPE
ncbi:thiol:disulfide interchange protein TlpA [Nitratireductor basaltis]|uniref:Redoxin n=1 Tax=Nitratireductor basaltis TaxID=472175 RepID=A0A084U7K8_9HYPH|nr:TlpA disulfide reductase family protein [Nitratireductor basaltis]KFB08944.1 Redoxin precursor [Nitratireductor basaltis]